MIKIAEHQKIEPKDLTGLNLDWIKGRINYNTSCFVASKINLIRYEFDPNPKFFKDGFYSYFRIGAEWLDKEQTKALIVLPKIPQIDFIEMFMTCLRSSAPEDDFSAIYDIDLDAKPIRSPLLKTILSTFLVVQFLMIVKQITDRGLRKGYVSREENISKVKGRIDFRKNEIRNIWTGHKERVYCRHDEFSVDTPENRYMKRALLIASNMISEMAKHKSYCDIYAVCNQCLSSFNDVSDTFEDFPIITRNNKLFREYSDALRYARMIIRKEEMAINSRHKPDLDIVPVFYIDMALLFEHYVLAKLRDSFGRNNVIYQAGGANSFYPDFLIKKGDLKVIADSKYTVVYKEGSVKGEYIKQLCGYARDTKLLRKLDIDCTDEDAVPIVPCTLIYPDILNQNSGVINLFKSSNKHTVKYFTTTVEIPTF